MAPGICRLLAALTLVLVPVVAAAQPIPSGALPGTEREQVAPPQPGPRAQPVGPSISLPSTVAPPGAESIMLTVSRIVITGATVYAEQDFAPLYADLVGREVPLAALYELARRITAKYGAAGYVLSRAIVPPQNFGRHGAVVRIQVVEGYVDNVIWPREKLARYRNFFDDYTARIVADRPSNIRTLERYLLLANDLPGLKFATTLKPSPTHPNASTLIVEVTEKRIDAIARIDNRGTEQRGPWQYLGSATVNNIIGAHEAFSVTYAGTFQLEELQYLAASYRQVLNSEGLSGFINASYGFGRPGGELLRAIEYKTRSAIVEAGLTYPVIRTRETNLYLTALGFMTNDDSFHVIGTLHPRPHPRLPPEGRRRLGRPLPRHQPGERHVQPGPAHSRRDAERGPEPLLLPPLPTASTNAGQTDFTKIEGLVRAHAAAVREHFGVLRRLRPVRVHAAARLRAMLLWRALLRPRLRSRAVPRRQLLDGARRSPLRHSEHHQAPHPRADLRLRGPRRDLQHRSGAGHAEAAERLIGRRRRAGGVGRHLHARTSRSPSRSTARAATSCAPS